jgi:hypothetical protein
VEHDIRGLDVAVDDTAFVRVIERIGGLAEDVERPLMRRHRLRFQERFESRPSTRSMAM